MVSSKETIGFQGLLCFQEVARLGGVTAAANSLGLVGSVNDDRLVARYVGQFRRILVASPGFVSTHDLRQVDDLSRVNCLIFSAKRTTSEWKFVSTKDDAQKVCSGGWPDCCA